MSRHGVIKIFRWTGILFILFLQTLFQEGCLRKKAILDGGSGNAVLPQGYENRFHQGMRYGLFIPPSYDSTRIYPLVVGLHGSTDTVSWNLSYYHDPIQKTDPCFVLTPKSLVRNSGWGNSWEPDLSTDMRKTLEVIDSLKKEFNIDTTRLYVYGTSMGGFGVFSVLAKKPGLFAGAYSICGGGNPQTAGAVMQTPLWIFHGSDDDVVPVTMSRNMVQAILNAGGTQVRYTEYPGVKHAAWEPAGREPTLESWLLVQRNGVKHSFPDTVENFSSKTIQGRGVQVSWNPPSDAANPDNQVWYYRLFRDQQLLVELDKFHLTFLDSTAQGGVPRLYNASSVNYFFKESRRTTPVSVTVA